MVQACPIVTLVSKEKYVIVKSDGKTVGYINRTLEACRWADDLGLDRSEADVAVTTGQVNIGLLVAVLACFAFWSLLVLAVWFVATWM